MLNKIFQRCASKFAIFLENENASIFFSFCATIFFPLVYVATQTRAFIRGKNKVAWKKKLREFSYSKIMANFEGFLKNIKLSINLLFLKSVCTYIHYEMRELPNSNISLKSNYIFQKFQKNLSKKFLHCKASRYVFGIICIHFSRKKVFYVNLKRRHVSFAINFPFIKK